MCLTPPETKQLLDPKQRYTRREAASILGVTRGTLEQWATKGTPRLRYFLVGGKAYYIRSDVEQFMLKRARTYAQDKHGATL